MSLSGTLATASSPWASSTTEELLAPALALAHLDLREAGVGDAGAAALLPLLAPAGELLMLVKPQFELQPGQVGKGGIVKDDSFYPFIEQRIRTALSDLGLTVVAWLDSPIEGGDGNREFFVQARQPAVNG